jgi:biotin carboxyl carrier protein
MTPSSRLNVIVAEDPARRDELLLESPAVGRFTAETTAGEVVVGGSRVGCLRSLGRRIDLVVPSGVTGRVVEVETATRRRPVGYGQLLLRLVPVEASGEGGAAAAGFDDPTGELPEGAFAVRSSIHGMFYQRPRPDEPPYVEIGQIVEKGATLGLVEVMKCFSAVVYGGPDLPARAEILEVRADDGAEVGTDEILFVVRRA